MSKTTETFFVRPAITGGRVPKENGEILKAEGEYVPRNSFWKRRIRESDVNEATPPKPARNEK